MYAPVLLSYFILISLPVSSDLMSCFALSGVQE